MQAVKSECLVCFTIRDFLLEEETVELTSFVLFLCPSENKAGFSHQDTNVGPRGWLIARKAKGAG